MYQLRREERGRGEGGKEEGRQERKGKDGRKAKVAVAKALLKGRGHPLGLLRSEAP